MLVYSYNALDKKYSGTLEVEQDPLDPTNWLIPSNCTLIAPPSEQENYNIIWNGTSWDQVIASDPVVEEQKQLALLVSRIWARLSNSDWAALPDVNLANKQAWLDYRAELRNLRTNPTEFTGEFPVEPPIIWA